MSKMKIEQHDGIDKSFGISIGNDFYARVDYDDVDHTKVDAATEYLKEVVQKHWDQSEFLKHYEKALKKEWDKNEYNMQDEYEDLADYLSQHGV